MRVLCKCVGCDEWFQHENGCDDPERVAWLVAGAPRVYDVMKCDWCRSLDRKNHYHIFFEEFTGIVETGMVAPPIVGSWCPEVEA